MTYRTPDPAAEIARLTRECERLRGELAAAKRLRGRWRLEPGGRWQLAWLGVSTATRAALIAADGFTPRHLAWSAAIVVLWVLSALLYVRREPAPSDGGGL